MLWIPLRQRRRAVGGQGIHAGAMVDPISGHIGVVPGALAHRRDPRHDAWRHFRRKTDFACGEVIVSACVDHCREKGAKPYGTRLWAGQAVSARLVGK